jgi:hypothetical protein
MKRRLVITATALGLLAAGAGIASAATPNTGTGIRLPSPGHQTCVVLYYTDGTAKYLCLNY